MYVASIGSEGSVAQNDSVVIPVRNRKIRL